MKHHAARRSECMKYFTPDLYLAFNSDDPKVADRADKKWEQAIAKYREHLTAIAEKLPLEARRFAEQVDLHDAEILNMVNFPSWLLRKPGTDSIVSILLEKLDAFVQLTYWLASPLTATPPRNDACFSPERRHWLYDEMDLDSPFVHQILFSDGSMLELPFLWFIASEIPKEKLSHPARSRSKRRVET
jgi:hypothetical protein